MSGKLGFYFVVRSSPTQIALAYKNILETTILHVFTYIEGADLKIKTYFY